MNQQTALEIFQYNPLTGDFMWADVIPHHYFTSPASAKNINSRYAGKRAGTIESNGYLQDTWSGNQLMVHRIIWLMMTGAWPSEHIDHKDHMRTNNIFTNLRDIPQEHNNAHKKNNRSGYSGIYEQKRNTNRPWMVQVFSKGKYLTQQSFADLQDAINHRDSVRMQHGLSQL